MKCIYYKKNLICFFVLALTVICFKDIALSLNNSSTSMAVTEKMLDLEEIVIGDKDAPITIVAYLSFTCGLCKKFLDDVLPKLNELINKKEIKIYLRHYADDMISKNSAMFVRCLGGNSTEKTKDLYLLTFKHQDDLMKIKTQQDIESFLAKMLPNEKISQEKIEKCKSNKEVYLGLEGALFEARITLGISSSPAFIIIKNGENQVFHGFLSYEDILERIK